MLEVSTNSNRPGECTIDAKADTKATGATPHSGVVNQPLSRGDLAISIVLLVLNLAAGIVMGIIAVLLVLAYDTCSVNECNYGGFNIGWLMAMLAPPLVLVAGMIATIVRLRRRRRAFWVPLVTLAIAAAFFFAGAQIVFMSVPGAGF